MVWERGSKVLLGALLCSGSAHAEELFVLRLDFEACISRDCAGGQITYSGRLVLQGTCDPYNGVCTGVVTGGGVESSVWTFAENRLALGATFTSGNNVDINALLDPATKCLDGSFQVLDRAGGLVSEGLWTGCKA